MERSRSIRSRHGRQGRTWPAYRGLRDHSRRHDYRSSDVATLARRLLRCFATSRIFHPGLDRLDLSIQFLDDGSFAIPILLSLLAVINGSKRHVGFDEIWSILDDLLQLLPRFLDL